MTDTVANIAKGKVAYYAGLPAANDALKAIPLETTGLEADGTLQDYDTVAALLAGASNEQTTMGRKTLAGVTVTVDDTNNRVDVDCTDPVWTAATGNAVSRLLVCYDPDTTASSDANNIPLVILDFVATPAGGDITYQVAAGGFYRAS
jgi:hypothetical protein